VTAKERRQEIIDMLVENGHVYVADLMDAFSVSRRTILFDIQELSLAYPIYTVVGRIGGGVYIDKDYKPGNRYITDEEKKVLTELIPKASDSQQKVLHALIKKFSVKRRAV